MHKTAGLILVCIACLLLASLPLNGEIKIFRDKNGNITITNEGAVPAVSRSKRAFRKSSAKSSASKSSSGFKVPAKYRAKIRMLANKYNVDESLIIAVARAESSFNPFAVSRKGAVGIMQLMPDTARQYGVTNRYDADQNMNAGVKHLKYLNKKYQYDLPLTLAAYNAGEEAVKKYRGVPPYRETRLYIKRVMKFMGRTYRPFISSKTSTKIYKYRTKDGKIMISDSFPSNAVGRVIVYD